MNHYFDIYLKGGPLPRTRDALGAVWRVTHACAAQSKTPFAVAFPHYIDGRTLGDVLRVFTQDERGADSILRGLDQQSHAGSVPMPDLISDIGRVQAVGTPLGYAAYFQERLPCKLSKRLEGDLEWAKRREDIRRNALARQREYPWAPMESSAGHHFILKVRREVVDPAATGLPNGYGLSRKTQVAPLPILL